MLVLRDVGIAFSTEFGWEELFATVQIEIFLQRLRMFGFDGVKFSRVFRLKYVRLGLIDIDVLISEISTLIVFFDVKLFEFDFFHMRFSGFEQTIKHAILFLIFGQQQRLVIVMVIGFSLSKMRIMTIFSFIRIRYVKTAQLGFGEGREDRVVFGDQVGRDQFKTCDALDSFGV
jgi:hypothetical protein